jgi:hypothetical protein
MWCQTMRYVACFALILGATACSNVSSNNPFREGAIYNAPAIHANNNSENIRVLSTGELLYR